MTDNSNNYAGFWVRTVALLIDLITFFVVYYVIATILDITPLQTTLGHKQLYIEHVIFITLTSLFLVSPWQATPGKRLVGIYVVDTNQKKIGLFTAFFRYLIPFAIFELTIKLSLGEEGRGISVGEQGMIQVEPVYWFALATPFLMLLVWCGFAGWTHQKTALHDIICKTRVARGKPS